MIVFEIYLCKIFNIFFHPHQIEVLFFGLNVSSKFSNAMINFYINYTYIIDVNVKILYNN